MRIQVLKQIVLDNTDLLAIEEKIGFLKRNPSTFPDYLIFAVLKLETLINESSESSESEHTFNVLDNPHWARMIIKYRENEDKALSLGIIELLARKLIN
jgi:hypothetical protein